jgi:hypothetical protein
MRTGICNGGEDFLGDADIARAPYAAAVTVKTRSEGEMLTSTSQLLHNPGQVVARVIRKTISKWVPPGSMTVATPILLEVYTADAVLILMVSRDYRNTMGSAEQLHRPF